MSRIITPYSAQSTAAEVVDGVDLTGRRAIVTGGASGIGLETARALADAGAEVTLAVRDTAAGERAAADITAGGAPGKVRVDHLDLADRASIDAFVAGWTGPLHILVNNAGIMALPELTRTADGWETQFAINHLGHAALTLGLHDALAAARAPASSSSARRPTSSPLSSSTTSTSPPAPTRRGRRTASRRPPPSCSPWPWPGSGPPTASPPTPCTPAAS